MHLSHNPRRSALKPALLLALSLTAFGHGSAQAAEPRVSLLRHAAQAPALRGARLLGRLATDTPLHLALILPLRNPAALDNLLRRQYTPGDPLYGRFLTSDEFVQQFGPTEEDYQAVAAWAEEQGLTVTGTHDGRTVLDVAGSAAQVESAFAIRMNHYQSRDGRIVFANSGAPRVARSVAARLVGVAGLSNVSLLRPYFHHHSPWSMALKPRVPVGGGTGIGTGPAGGLSPNDVKFAYGLSTIAPLYGAASGTTATGTGALLDGTGQTIGLFELDSYDPNDIKLFVTQFSLPTVLPTATTLGTVRPVAVDNFVLTGTTGAGRDEVTLDIDMVLALAPNAAAVYSYEGNQGSTLATFNPAIAVDIFQQMADDKALDGSGKPLLQVISTSWGQAEADEDPAILAAEHTIFQKMAAQGQSLFSATGDLGAYDGYPTRPQRLEVDSPASDPLVTAVGGTTLRYSKPTTTAGGVVSPGSYISETVWKTGTVNNPTGPEGGGGGSSVAWSKPSYQVGLGHSATARDIPDVALNADPATGYDIYINGAAVTVGGTSAAAPLWAAFTALVNQKRGLNGLAAPLGFANPSLYSLAQGTSYSTLFHDITLGDNLYYLADVGFDDATGFGSFIGAPLVAALSFNSDQGAGAATLSGFVTDNSSPAIPIAGATVTATSIATGTLKATTTTDMTGAYTLTAPGGLALKITVNTATVVATGGTNYASPTPASLTLTAGVTTTQNFVLLPAHTFASGLQMISAPYDFTGLGDFATLFGLTTPLANPNPRLLQWQPSLGAYQFYPSVPADTLRLGQGYWIKFPVVNYLHLLGIPASLSQSYRIPLTAGWNQIGDPFPGSVPLSTVTADTAISTKAVALTDATSPVQPNLFRYDTGAGDYAAVNPASAMLDPYNGYWIYAKQAAVLIVPPVAGPPPPPGGSPTPPPVPGG